MSGLHPKIRLTFDRQMRDLEHQRSRPESVQPLDRRVCVAPMMDWTDRHCRFLHRLYAPHALLYTEMIVAAAIVRGDVRQLLDHDAGEHPVALQLGGCNPAELAKAARIGTSAGYAEINLNVGLPQRSRAKRLVWRLPHAEACAGCGLRAQFA